MEGVAAHLRFGVAHRAPLSWKAIMGAMSCPSSARAASTRRFGEGRQDRREHVRQARRARRPPCIRDAARRAAAADPPGVHRAPARANPPRCTRRRVRRALGKIKPDGPRRAAGFSFARVLFCRSRPLCPGRSALSRNDAKVLPNVLCPAGAYAARRAPFRIDGARFAEADVRRACSARRRRGPRGGRFAVSRPSFDGHRPSVPLLLVPPMIGAQTVSL